MGWWHAVMVVGRTMRIAVMLSIMLGGFFFVKSMKKGPVSTLTGKIGMLAGANNNIAMPMPLDAAGDEDLLAAIKLPGLHKPSRNELPLPHPGVEPAITLLRRSTFQPQADHEYQVRIGDGEHAVYRWLPLENGANVKMKAYWYPPGDGHGPCIRFRDYYTEHLIDLDKRKTYLLIRYAGRVFAGEISESDPGYLTSTARGPDGEEKIRVYVGGNEAANITHTALASSPGAYFGGIEIRPSSLKFIPAPGK
ncbi:MAG: hypothetical protein JW959_07710 [Pirellulales bacterium]|nr:hypothetical protein [Pirellulales bacterium]